MIKTTIIVTTVKDKFIFVDLILIRVREAGPFYFALINMAYRG